jgi:quercetin dioxygenase-like cupin family protein
MAHDGRRFGWIFCGIAAIAVMGGLAALQAQPDRSGPRPKVVSLERGGRNYIPVLGGPPETISMRSGLVVLAPGKAVGKHNTESYEELLVVLEGKGEMIFGDRSTLPANANSAVYCPPHTEHDVRNTGAGDLRYVYVAAGARPGS